MTARRFALYAGIGIAIYLATLAVTIPAPWAGSALERISGQRLQLREPAGSLWAGSGRLYASPRAGPLRELGVLRWRTSWAGILGARLAVDVTLGTSKPAVVLLSPGGAAIRGVDLMLPARIIASFVPEFDSFGPGGQLRLRSDDMRFDRDSILGLAELEWRDVQLARMPGIGLGSHVVRLRGAGGKVNIELATIDGPLRLSGSGTWTRSAGLSLSGAAEHDAQSAPAFAAFLTGMCPRYRGNRCTFQIRQ
ncbi:MAG: type II secretion system protein N [Betaproteobacteria bacterium]|nr:type II secretion system protein N [Betaproteobacteria bacterium]